MRPIGSLYLHDAMFRELSAEKPGLRIAWYLMASYAYYCLDSPILTDATYDALCKDLVFDAAMGDLPEHIHSHLVKIGDIEVGTCMIAEEDYPSIVKGAVHNLTSS